MKHPARLLLFVSLILLASAAPSVAEEPIPSPKTLDLTQWQGRVVLVDFWASWCAPCIESFPWMSSMLDRYGERGLTIVAVNLDEDPEAARAFLEGVNGKFQHVRDPGGASADAFGVTVMPSSLLFDREGNPAYRHEGFHSEQTAEYEQRIVALLEGRDDGDREEIALGSRGRKKRMGVRPWQRGLLADEAMSLDADPLDLAIDDHIYFSKEASSGGRGFGGGGCGCN